MNMSIGMAFVFFLLGGFHPAQTSDVNDNINRVVNPSFEFIYTTNTYGKIPLHWERYSGSGHCFNDSGDSYQGERSWELRDTDSNGSVSLQSEPIPVTPGYVYRTQVWAKKSSASVTSQFYLSFYDDNDNLLYNPLTSVGSVGNWSTTTEEWTAPANSSYARILLYSSYASVGTTYVDSVSLTLADERISDGDFDDATTGELPVHWKVYATHTGTVQDAQIDGGNMRLRLTDTNANEPSGVYYKVPASGGVPYKFSASVRKVDGGSAMIYLEFYDTNNSLLSSSSRYTSSSVYTNLSIAEIAPSNAVYAKVLCYINGASTGTAYFDEISFAEDYGTFYAGPSSSGTGLGDTPGNCAEYIDTNFWNLVDAAANTYPVKVVLLTGDYWSFWKLAGIGNETFPILITGENPFSVNYKGSSSTANYMLVYDCRNIIFRHFHFSDASDANEYEYVMRFGDSGYVTKDIRCEGLTYSRLQKVKYGATGAHYGVTNLVWDHCVWTHIGTNTAAHCIYNCYGSSSHITDCHFEDCSGGYVKFRNKAEGTVSYSTFLSSGTHPIGYVDHTHQVFIQIAAVNPNGYSRDEYIGTNFWFHHNSFTYLNPDSSSGYRSPFCIKIDGGSPVSNTNYYRVPPAIGAEFMNTNISVSTRRGYMHDYFGMDLPEDCRITDNTYSGCWTNRFSLAVSPDYEDRQTWWYQPLWSNPDINCYLDDLVDLD